MTQEDVDEVGANSLPGTPYLFAHQRTMSEGSGSGFEPPYLSDSSDSNIFEPPYLNHHKNWI